MQTSLASAWLPRPQLSLVAVLVDRQLSFADLRARETTRPHGTIRVGLVGCAKTKRGEAARARELYTSPLFRGSLAYAEAHCDDVWIVSAFHGLVDPDRVIPPYERTLRGERQRAREAWGERVFADLRRRYGGRRVELVILAGELYAAPIAALVRMVQAGGMTDGLTNWRVEIPLRGLSIGKRLAWLKSRRPMTDA